MLQLRRGVLSDASAIKALAEAAYLAGDAVFLQYDSSYERIPLAEVKEMITHRGVFLVGSGTAHNNGGGTAPSIGVCVFVSTASRSRLTEMSVLAVSPSLQGRGLSVLVLDAAFALAKQLGYDQVESDVLACKPWLLQFYKNNGWSLTGATKPW